MESQVMRQIGRIVAGGYDDHQHVREQMMNRIRIIVRAKNEGLSLDKPEKKKEQIVFEAKYQDANLPVLLGEMIEANKITSTEHDYLLKALELANKAMSLEKSFVGPMEQLIDSEPLWTTFLLHVRGIGPVIATKLMAKIGNCSRYGTVSALWRHFGLHVVCPVCVEEVDGKIRPKLVNLDGKCECGLTGVSSKRRVGQNIDFDPRLRTLAWVIGTSLMRQKSPVYYDKIYEAEKNRQLARVYSQGELSKIYGKSYNVEDTNLKPIHAHNRALRKMVKIFLQHCWVVSRKTAGLPVSNPYIIGKSSSPGGHIHEHIISYEEVLRENDKEAAA